MFRALVIDDDGAALRRLDDDYLGDPSRPADGWVALDVLYSGINYKDAMALTGRPGVVRRRPLIAGIDVVGQVTASGSPAWTEGAIVLLNGTGLSETLHGGLAERAVVPADRLVALPDAFSPVQAAAIGTAGYTAALCLDALDAAGLAPGSEHPVAVTGATGGVGSVAVALLAAAGFEVAAVTGRPEAYAEYLTGLGAAEVLERSEFEQVGRPLGTQRFSGAVDTAGGQVLATLLSQIDYGGTVAACGLAAGTDLPATVMPFILRSVTLAGVDSVQAPLPARDAAWARLARDLPGGTVDSLSSMVPLDGAIAAAEDLLAGRSHGRVVVDVRA